MFIDAGASRLSEPIGRRQCYEKCMETGKRATPRSDQSRNFLSRFQERAANRPSSEQPSRSLPRTRRAGARSRRTSEKRDRERTERRCTGTSISGISVGTCVSSE